MVGGVWVSPLSGSIMNDPGSGPMPPSPNPKQNARPLPSVETWIEDGPPGLNATSQRPAIAGSSTGSRQAGSGPCHVQDPAAGLGEIVVQAAVEARDQIQVAGAEVALNQPDRAHGRAADRLRPGPPARFPRLQWPRPPPEQRSDHLERAVLRLDESRLT